MRPPSHGRIVGMIQPPRTIGQVFVWAAVAEAITWVALLVGMFFKYVTETTDVLVSIFGAVHGGVFILYCVVAVLAAFRLKWPLWAVAVALIAAVPPLMTIPAEKLIRRKRLLSQRQESPSVETVSQH